MSICAGGEYLTNTRYSSVFLTDLVRLDCSVRGHDWDNLGLPGGFPTTNISGGNSNWSMAGFKSRHNAVQSSVESSVLVWPGGMTR